MGKKRKRYSSEEEEISDKVLNNTKITKKYDFKNIFESEENHAILLVGPRKSGKSTLLASLFPSIRKKFDVIIIFCNNSQSSVYDYLTEHEREFVFDKYQPNIIKSIDEYQKKTENFLRFLILFDDCSSRKGNKFDDNIIQLFIRGRNINCSVIFSTQASTFLAKESKTNLDLAVCFDLKSPDSYINFANGFLQSFIRPPEDIKGKSKREGWYMEFMQKNTQNHKTIILNYEDLQLYTFKAKISKVKK